MNVNALTLLATKLVKLIFLHIRLSVIRYINLQKKEGKIWANSSTPIFRSETYFIMGKQFAKNLFFLPNNINREKVTASVYVFKFI